MSFPFVASYATTIRPDPGATGLNGELIQRRTNLRWRCHRQMGVEGIWYNWYFGGKQSPDKTMHYQVRDVVIQEGV